MLPQGEFQLPQPKLNNQHMCIKHTKAILPTWKEYAAADPHKAGRSSTKPDAPVLTARVCNDAAAGQPESTIDGANSD